MLEHIENITIDYKTVLEEQNKKEKEKKEKTKGKQEKEK
jgi:hypothetical protein